MFGTIKNTVVKPPDIAEFLEPIKPILATPPPIVIARAKQIAQQIKEAQSKGSLGSSYLPSTGAGLTYLASNDAGITSKLTKPTGDQLDQWLLEALKITGEDPGMLPYLRTIAMHESSGNPRAINDWDSNAKAGHPSKGLMQTIDSTFAAHALPGYGDIWNPVDNAIAAIRYAKSRYGSLRNVPGIISLAKGGKYIGY